MDIYCPYIRVSTHGHVQNIGQIHQKPFSDISSFWNIYKGNILYKFQENSSMYDNAIFGYLAKYHLLENKMTSPKPLKLLNLTNL